MVTLEEKVYHLSVFIGIYSGILAEIFEGISLEGCTWFWNLFFK